MIEINGLSYRINDKFILNDVNTHFAPAEFTAVIGLNGSGKSTMVRHINGLIPVQNGTVTIDGVNVCDRKSLGYVRRTVGMVFQNPDLQSVAPTVEDDVAFGPENMGLTRKEIEERISFALAEADGEHLRHRQFSTLSGGEKQRIAIASVLAIKPKYIIFDEATSMLDPISRTSTLRLAQVLRDRHGIGIIWITHNPDEAALCDRVVLMHSGTVVSSGTPTEIFYNGELTARYQVQVPDSVRLAQEFKSNGYDIGTPLTAEDAAGSIMRILRGDTNA